MWINCTYRQVYMTSDVTVVSMAKRFALITHRFLEFDLLSGEEDQPDSALMARKMEKVGPDQKQRFAGCSRSVAGGTPASARTGARARSAHGCTGARGEGAAKVTVGEVVR
ncbi:MAG: hypothetical protein NTY37_08760 [Methanothrix sp.]|nr:hypothetical protein [Methanothrix sp.]